MQPPAAHLTSVAVAWLGGGATRGGAVGAGVLTRVGVLHPPEVTKRALHGQDAQTSSPFHGSGLGADRPDALREERPTQSSADCLSPAQRAGPSLGNFRMLYPKHIKTAKVAKVRPWTPTVPLVSMQEVTVQVGRPSGLLPDASAD